MSYADKVFCKMCENVLEKNNMNECRAIWTDTGEKSSTISDFAVVNRYNLNEEFPILTVRPVPIKSAIDEILWIYQKKSNNIKDLNSHVWDEWADDNGSIGAAYGYQVGTQLKKVKVEKIEPDQFNSGVEMVTVSHLYLDQTDYVLHELKHNPFSRRIIMNLYHPGQVDLMGLEPCAFLVNFKVTKNNETGNLVLNCVLYQRSQDILVANGWNVVQYAALTHMFAQVSNMEVGEFVHVIADAHIYDRHIETVKELIKRPQFEAPKLAINPKVKNFYDFKPSDFDLLDYKHGEQIKGIDVAV